MSDSSLERVKKLAATLIERQEAVKALEDKLKAAKKDLTLIQRDVLPDLMAEIGLEEITLAGGKKVSLQLDCLCGISKANQPRAIAWLNANGYGGLVKNAVTVRLPRGSDGEASKVCDELAQRFDEVELKEDVHAATLKSFVMERLREGDAIPHDLFGIMPFNKAVVK